MHTVPKRARGDETPTRTQLLDHRRGSLRENAKQPEQKQAVRFLLLPAQNERTHARTHARTKFRIMPHEATRGKQEASVFSPSALSLSLSLSVCLSVCLSLSLSLSVSLFSPAAHNERHAGGDAHSRHLSPVGQGKSLLQGRRAGERDRLRMVACARACVGCMEHNSWFCWRV